MGSVIVDALHAISSPVTRIGISALGCLALYLIIYIIYQRYFHPLAKYPGPFLASLTDLWQVAEVISLKQPYNLTALHEKYGEFVRYGPDKLSTTTEDAIPILYQKGGRMFPKTEFYDSFGAYGAAVPNIFGMRDDAMHSTRRRHMSHSFSLTSVKNMEPYLDTNIEILRRKLNRYCESGEVFDLKTVINFYIIDVLGELAFGRSFGIQEAADESLIPPVVGSTYIAAVIGSWPAMMQTLKKWLPTIPSRRLKTLFESRMRVVALASACVRERLAALKDVEENDEGTALHRKDILTSLILAKDPETGERLTEADLITEAYGSIVAGTHTTVATTSILFYHLLHNPQILAKCVAEIDSSLPSLNDDRLAYSIAEVETSLPYVKQCIKENFRITPVFTMMLARQVLAPEGVVIGGERIPAGTSIAVCNHAFHHNPRVWGEDHDTFDPDRWNQAETVARSRYLMHFGGGSRQCLGKTIAHANIYKLVSTLLKEYHIELEEKSRESLPDLISVSISDLACPLMVRLRLRKTSKQSNAMPS